MSVKIRISYETEEELAGIVRLLSPVMKSYKIQPSKGRYKRAYFDLKSGAFRSDLVKKKKSESPKTADF